MCTSTTISALTFHSERYLIQQYKAFQTDLNNTKTQTYDG